ncbi:MAG TPA: hypothetical protein VHG32_24245 [Thermoanaerobaculia bacterium]|jgi:hypothetical protein|nr:hypothetical protein [Thermoanaerobaculia bacterium]
MEQQGSDQQIRQCPFCAEDVRAAAIVCKHCGRNLGPRPPLKAMQKVALLAAGMVLALVGIAALLLVAGSAAKAPARVPNYLPASPQSTTSSPPSQPWTRAPQQPPAAVDSVAPESSGSDYSAAEQTIRAHCTKEWPTDYHMQAYCTDQQHQALSALLSGRPADVPEAEFSRMREHCASEWPDDFHMRAYCEKQQADGYRKIN